MKQLHRFRTSAGPRPGRALESADKQPVTCQQDASNLPGVACAQDELRRRALKLVALEQHVQAEDALAVLDGARDSRASGTAIAEHHTAAAHAPDLPLAASPLVSAKAPLPIVAAFKSDAAAAGVGEVSSALRGNMPEEQPRNPAALPATVPPMQKQQPRQGFWRSIGAYIAGADKLENA